MSKRKSEKIDKKVDVSLSSTFPVLSRFRVFLSDGSSKTPQKNVSQRNALRDSHYDA
jgi:hypothetical protein